jgi:DNA-directed RNA polymerase specialized sigma24 family protein
MMTRVLLDRMKKRRLKHESLPDSVPLRPALIVEDILAVRECLNKLRQIDRRAAKVVNLRFYGGLSNIETAEVMGVSVATVEADWRFASAWLFVQLKKDRQNGNSP